MTTDPVNDAAERGDQQDKENYAHDVLKHSRLDAMSLDRQCISDFLNNAIESNLEAQYPGIVIPANFIELFIMAIRSKNVVPSHIACRAMRECFDAYYDDVATDYANVNIAEFLG
jgi:hypothetical protein